MISDPAAGKRIVLGVTGSIAAYKAADIASQLVGRHAEVFPVMTRSATKLLGPATLRSLTGHTCLTDVFDESEEGRVAHISIIEGADLVIVAPATANVIGKIAHGIGDDMLTTMLIAARCPVLIAPAMNTNMWANPIVIGNVDRLKTLGYHFVEPVEGRLACGAVGLGKLAPVEDIVAAAESLLNGSREQDWAGVRLLVTAGPTREPIDPVRYLSNRSSGTLGYAIASAAQGRGAEVTLVTGPTALPAPEVSCVEQVETAAQMLDAVRRHFDECDVVIAAAAVSDFSPHPAASKLKKQAGKPQTLELSETTDILAEVGRNKGNRVLVGFALETENLETGAIQKLRAKNLDMVIANLAGSKNQPFGSGPSRVRVFTSDGEDRPWPVMSKPEIAQQMLTMIRDKYLKAQPSDKQ